MFFIEIEKFVFKSLLNKEKKKYFYQVFIIENLNDKNLIEF